MRPDSLLVISTITACCLFVALSAQTANGNAGDDRNKLVGDWSGESICVGNRPACEDEQVVYRIALTPNEPDKVTITMEKIVAGKPNTMAVLDFTYNGNKGTLINEFIRRTTHGLWEFTVNKNVIEGTLSMLPEKSIGRRVHITKDK
ncbi:MAG: hypothetical protein ABI967_12805 [bacterium]